MGSNLKKPNIVVICGPTGIGKTSVSLQLAEALNADIISADSMQVYRYMDIGTAKPTPDERARVPHHMVDVVDPDTPFDAARYVESARKVIRTLHDQGKLPLVVGGTGLYIKSLIHGVFRSRSQNQGIRERLRGLAATHGVGFLYRILSEKDPWTAERLHPNDTYRILRSLEVLELTGESISAHHQAHGFRDTPFRFLTIALDMDRQALYERINRRTDQMIEAGFLHEVECLLKMGYGPNLKSMKSIGYRHMVGYLQGFMPWDETIEKLKRDTRRYAKRQMTWFRSDPDTVRAESMDPSELLLWIENFLHST